MDLGLVLLAPAVLAFSLRPGNALRLTFLADIGFKSAKTLSMSKNALPAAVLVSIGCSVAFRLAPLARSVLTTSAGQRPSAPAWRALSRLTPRA